MRFGESSRPETGFQPRHGHRRAERSRAISGEVPELEGRGGQGAGRPGDDAPQAPPGIPGRRACPARGRAGAGQDPGRPHGCQQHLGRLREDPVHPGHAAGRRDRHPDLQSSRGQLLDQEGADLRQPDPGRRDQPRAGQGPGRSARGDAGAPGDARRPDPGPAGAVPRHGHPEPDRAGGDVPAPRGAARPLHAEDRRRLPEQGRGGQDPRPHGRREPRAAGLGGARAGGHPGRPGRGEAGLRRRQGQALRGRPGLGDARSGQRRPAPAQEPHRERRLGARVDQGKTADDLVEAILENVEVP